MDVAYSNAFWCFWHVCKAQNSLVHRGHYLSVLCVENNWADDIFQSHSYWTFHRAIAIFALFLATKGILCSTCYILLLLLLQYVDGIQLFRVGEILMFLFPIHHSNIKFLCRMGSGHPGTNVQLAKRFTLYQVWREAFRKGRVNSEMYLMTGPAYRVGAVCYSVSLCSYI